MARNLCPSNLILFLIIRFSVCSNNAIPIVSDTLAHSDTLNYAQVLQSANGYFQLAFIKPNKNTNNSYLCILHLDSPSFHGQFEYDKCTWIANRNTPIVDDTANLTIDNTGSLIIRHSRGDPIALYVGNSTHSSNVSATLHDNGNFVLSELNADGSAGTTLWQSFDHPTDSFLPGMRLGLDEKTGRRSSITSWLGKNNPSPGSFSLDWDPSQKQLVLRRRGIVVWTSGVFKDDTFLHIPQTDVHSLFLTIDGNSMSYSVNGSMYWKLDDEGTLYFIYSPFEGSYFLKLPIMDLCYGYNSDKGCVECLQPKCRNVMPTFRQQHGFFRRIDGNETESGFHYANASVSAGDCRALCWEDCDCVAYCPADDIGCLFWMGELEFVLDSEKKESEKYVITSSIPSQSPSQSPHSSNGNNEQFKAGRKQRKWLAIMFPAFSGILFLAVVICCVTWKQKGKKLFLSQEMGNSVAKLKEKYLSEYRATSKSDDIDELGDSLKVFNLKTISEATDKFSQQNILGEGGFGPVYKGTLPEGNEIAVKRLSRGSGQGLMEFKNELKLIAKLQHVNLVRILGCCVDGEEKILIYEYMPNKSLDSFLFDPSKGILLKWITRVKIIEGIAQGLLYLHEHSRLMIIHRDLKASNILLDASLNPKISDFGMARIFRRNELMANTKRIVGTYGYMSPEYAMVGIFSVKSDVFSFGVLIIEIVSGRRNNSFCNYDEHPNLIGYAWALWQRNAWTELIDPSIKESCSMKQLQRFIHIGLLCVEDSVSDRPRISEVISMLMNENTPLPSVKKPAFLFWGNANELDSYVRKLESYSTNVLSTSSYYAR